MRLRLLGVYLLMQAALCVVALHFVLPLGPSLGEPDPSFAGLVRFAVITSIAALLVLSPLCVLELTEVWQYRAWRTWAATITGLVLLTVPGLISLTDQWDESGTRLGVLAGASAFLAIHAGKKWRDAKPEPAALGPPPGSQAAAGPTPPRPDAPM